MSGLTYSLCPNQYVYIWHSLFFMWQNYHFGRQNSGLNALLNTTTFKIRSNNIEKHSLQTATILGLLGGVWFNTGGTHYHDLIMIIRNTCGILTLILILFSLFYSFLIKMEIKRFLFYIFSIVFLFHNLYLVM